MERVVGNLKSLGGHLQKGFRLQPVMRVSKTQSDAVPGPTDKTGNGSDALERLT